ncbi:hypothetical protein B9Z55_029102 [Caenorhabditis nigoni]|uniref:Uncharacterized protein n=1 Tax=Caenorhabditis nigoni TaxID=1611254 RepID=A0A2G5S8M0_9PELO|nr:hypothetical protein B9Z55_029102 [Caenorhabditis nigoni]
MSELSDDEVSLQALFEPAKKLIPTWRMAFISTAELQPRLKTGIENLHSVTKLVNQLRCILQMSRLKMFLQILFLIYWFPAFWEFSIKI